LEFEAEGLEIGEELLGNQIKNIEDEFLEPELEIEKLEKPNRWG
jgi:hypothetical protein